MPSNPRDKRRYSSGTSTAGSIPRLANRSVPAPDAQHARYFLWTVVELHHYQRRSAAGRKSSDPRLLIDVVIRGIEREVPNAPMCIHTLPLSGMSPAFASPMLATRMFLVYIS